MNERRDESEIKNQYLRANQITNDESLLDTKEPIISMGVKENASMMTPMMSCT